tara:strand:- start:16911 stop:17957 length:1047 start_codon:yes stop_codon:yes gene_type:complete
MKTIYKFYILSLVIITFTCCETEYNLSIKNPSKSILNDKVNINLVEENNYPIKEVTFFVNGKQIPSSKKSFTLDTKDFGTGKHIISAMVIYGDQKSKRINSSVEVFSNIPFTSYDFKIKNIYPHDETAYTQGLEYHNGFLYESTGQNGKSSLRKVELRTGKILQKIDLDRRYFGEGMTIIENKIFFLTWKSNKGFVYNLNTFELESEFLYDRSKEGWGLTHSDTELIKSDGTSKIWFLDPKTQKEQRYIQAYTNKQSISQLNELEFINGKIYANYWQKPLIAIINPTNGIVEGIINLSNLVKEIGKTQKLVKENDVLNGIAYDNKNDRLFVTGKNWKKLFEIELVKKQ